MSSMRAREFGPMRKLVVLASSLLVLGVGLGVMALPAGAQDQPTCA